LVGESLGHRQEDLLLALGEHRLSPCTLRGLLAAVEIGSDDRSLDARGEERK